MPGIPLRFVGFAPEKHHLYAYLNEGLQAPMLWSSEQKNVFGARNGILILQGKFAGGAMVLLDNVVR